MRGSHQLGALVLLVLLCSSPGACWRCSGCPADPSCSGTCTKCDPLCVHGTCVHDQCACNATFGKTTNHACDACADGFSGYPNCIPDPPDARFQCDASKCVENAGGPFSTSTCDHKCGAGPPPPPGPRPPPGPPATCGGTCGFGNDCPARNWAAKNASESGCFKCERYGNHAGPLCMTLEAFCCNHLCDRTREECYFTCDYPTNRSSMPQHLAIGDSITDGQFPDFKALLNTTVDSHLIPINGGDTGEGVTCAGVWTQDYERWDVVSYNFGAWDVDSSDCNLTRTATGQYLDPKLQLYVDRLTNITAQLNRTRAARTGRLVYVLTTPSPQVPECCDDPSAAAASVGPGKLRTHTCVKRTAVFNEAAKILLQPMGVKILDLWAWVAKKCPTPYKYDCPIQTMKPGDPCQVHFDQPDGWAYVAQGYAAGIKAVMSGEL